MGIDILEQGRAVARQIFKARLVRDRQFAGETDRPDWNMLAFLSLKAAGLGTERQIDEMVEPGNHPADIAEFRVEPARLFTGDY